MDTEIRHTLVTIPTISARRAWRHHALELMNHLHKMRTAKDVREFTRDVPLMMSVNAHMNAWGVSVILDHTNRDFIFYAPDGSILDRLKCSYLLYRRVIKDQNESSIVKFWDV